MNVTFMANVKSVTGVPTGTVQFFDGASLVGTATLDNGKARLTTYSLNVGSHSITAIYTGNNDFIPSTSSVLTQIVNAAVTSTALTSSKNPSPIYAAVTFTAQVSAATDAGYIPDGLVKFFVDNVPYTPDPLDATGKASHTFQFLTAGPRIIKVVYLGTSNFAGSVASLKQVVKPR